MIWRVGDILSARAEEFGQLEALDNGKSVAIATAVDVAWAADVFRYYAGWATKIEGSTVNVSMPFSPGGEFHAYTLREAIGVCGLIVPWNFPLLMSSWKLAPALAAGNTVILKPAEQTPLTALLLAEVFEEAGFPPRRRQHRSRLRRCRCCSVRPRRRGQGCVHRFHRGG